MTDSEKLRRARHLIRCRLALLPADPKQTKLSPSQQAEKKTLEWVFSQL